MQTTATDSKDHCLSTAGFNAQNSYLSTSSSSSAHPPATGKNTVIRANVAPPASSSRANDVPRPVLVLAGRGRCCNWPNCTAFSSWQRWQGQLSKDPHGKLAIAWPWRWPHPLHAPANQRARPTLPKVQYWVIAIHAGPRPEKLLQCTRSTCRTCTVLVKKVGSKSQGA